MARTEVEPINLIHASGIDTTTTVEIDATLVTNGVTVVGGGAKKGTIVAIVSNDSESEGTVTLGHGGYPGAGTTDLVVDIPDGEEVAIAITESALFEQTDESYHLDFSEGFTGALQVLRVPS